MKYILLFLVLTCCATSPVASVPQDDTLSKRHELCMQSAMKQFNEVCWHKKNKGQCQLDATDNAFEYCNVFEEYR